MLHVPPDLYAGSPSALLSPFSSHLQTNTSSLYALVQLFNVRYPVASLLFLSGVFTILPHENLLHAKQLFIHLVKFRVPDCIPAADIVTEGRLAAPAVFSAAIPCAIVVAA